MLEESALGALLAGALLILIVMSFVFKYHWRRFGIPTPLFRRVTRAYFWISGGLSALAVLLYGVVLMSF